MVDCHTLTAWWKFKAELCLVRKGRWPFKTTPSKAVDFLLNLNLAEVILRWLNTSDCRNDKLIWPSTNKKRTLDLKNEGKHWNTDTDDGKTIEYFLCSCPALRKLFLRQANWAVKHFYIYIYFYKNRMCLNWLNLNSGLILGYFKGKTMGLVWINESKQMDDP